MFSQLTINIKKKKFKPGESVSGTVSLRSAEPIRARSLTISLICNEWIDVGAGKTRESYIKKIFEKMIVLEKEKELQNMEKDFSFVLPANAPPTITIGGNLSDFSLNRQGTGLTWKLNARVDIPLAIDINTFEYLFIE